MGVLELLEVCDAQGLLPCYVGDRRAGLRRVGPPRPAQASALWLLVHADLRRAARVRALIDFLVPRLKQQAELFRGERPAQGQS